MVSEQGYMDEKGGINELYLDWRDILIEGGRPPGR
jgi:hypothetical protein